MRRVIAFLRQKGINVWVDNEKLVPGTPIWEEEIEKAIRWAGAVVVLCSPDAKASKWVRREISFSEDYEKRIFPLLIDGEKKNSIPLSLTTSQYVDVRQNEESGLKSLCTALSFYLASLEAQEQKESREGKRLVHATTHPAQAALNLSGTAESLVTLPFSVQPISAQSIAPIIELARLGKGRITEVGYAPDGNTLAVASSLGIYIYDVYTFKQKDFIETNSRVNSIAFSPDGAILASGSDDRTVRLWRISDGKLINSLEGHTSSVINVAFSPDGTVLASGSGDRTIRLWRVSDGKLLNSLEGHNGWVESVAFSPDGTVLASGSGDRMIRLWRVSDGKLLNSLEGHTTTKISVAFSPDGIVLASGSQDRTIRLWRVSDGKLLKFHEGYTDYVRIIAFSPDGAILASGANDGPVRLWRVSDGKLLNSLEGHTTSVDSVAFSPDGTFLASGSGDGTVRLWRVSDGKLLKSLEEHSSSVLSVAFSPDGSILASGDWDRKTPPVACQRWRIVQITTP